MNVQTPIRENYNRTGTEGLGLHDLAFVRLAAVIVEKPEEVILASLLALRSKPENANHN